mmetsp:Transcript_24992/g.45261  ORF Transcript_24992/g.45261 Transcript_24992/m.45261 type:complete len:267 (+) Transcript_24992:154-954(+)
MCPLGGGLVLSRAVLCHERWQGLDDCTGLDPVEADEGEALPWGVEHTVGSGLEHAVCPPLHHVPDDHEELPRLEVGGIDPLLGGLARGQLQACRGLVHDGEHLEVGVPGDAKGFRFRVGGGRTITLCRVVQEALSGPRVLGRMLRKGLRREVEDFCQCAEHGARDTRHQRVEEVDAAPEPGALVLRGPDIRAHVDVPIGPPDRHLPAHVKGRHQRLSTDLVVRLLPFGDPAPGPRVLRVVVLRLHLLRQGVEGLGPVVASADQGMG